MPSLGKKSVYIDTNQFVFARASETFPKKYRKGTYYTNGKKCIEVLQACRRRGIVVVTSMVTRVELQALHLDWHRRKRLIEIGMPPGFALGGFTGEYIRVVRDLFTRKERTAIYDELDNWFQAWGFNTLVRWVRPDDIRYWRELTEIVLRYVQRGQVADALHLGAAIGLECTKFFTRDDDLRSAIREMRDDKNLMRELSKRGFIDKSYSLPDPITDKQGLLT